MNLITSNDCHSSDFDSIYNKYNIILYKYLLKKTGSSYFAHEVVQETFIKLWRQPISNYDNIDISAWIFQIAKCSLIDILRKEERERIKLKHINSGSSNVVSTNYEMNYKNGFNEILSLLEGKIPPMRKKVFIMRIREELSHKEIAESLQISTKTVARHLDLAFRQIKPMLSNSIIILLPLIILKIS